MLSATVFILEQSKTLMPCKDISVHKKPSYSAKSYKTQTTVFHNLDTITGKEAVTCDTTFYSHNPDFYRP